jgi:hypothetical protein
LVPELGAAVVADRDLDAAVDVASVGPLPKRKLPLARDDAALLAEIALMYVVQVGHRRHRPLLTLTPQFSFLLKGFGTCVKHESQPRHGIIFWISVCRCILV